MTRGAIVAAFGCIAVVVSLWFFPGTKNGEPEAATAPRSASTASGAPSSESRAAAEFPVSEVPQAQEHRETVRDRLRDYWGARWPEMEARLMKDGANLDRPIEDGEILPWEEVEAALHDQFVGTTDMIVKSWEGAVDWPEEVTEKLVLDNFRIDPRLLTSADVSAVESIAREHNQGIREAAQSLWVGLSSALDASWRLGRFERGPFHLECDDPEPGRPILVMTSAATHGWGAGAVIYEDEYPDLAQLKKSVTQLKNARTKAIQAYLSSLK